MSHIHWSFHPTEKHKNPTMTWKQSTIKKYNKNDVRTEIIINDTLTTTYKQ